MNTAGRKTCPFCWSPTKFTKRSKRSESSGCYFPADHTSADARLVTISQTVRPRCAGGGAVAVTAGPQAGAGAAGRAAPLPFLDRAERARHDEQRDEADCHTA